MTRTSYPQTTSDKVVEEVEKEHDDVVELKTSSPCYPDE